MAASEPWVLARCRETSRNEALVWAGIALATLLPMLLAWSDARAVLMGPARADAAAFDGGLSSGVVEIDAQGAVDTGVSSGPALQHGSVAIPVAMERQRSFFAVPMGAQSLIVESKRAPQGLVVGRLEPMPPDLELALSGAGHLPLVLRTDAPARWGWVVVTIGALGLAGCGFGAVRQLMRAGDPRRHPAAARVASWGDLADLSEQIQDDMDAAEVRRGARSFGSRYFVVDAWSAFEVRRWEDLLWVYVRQVQRKVHGIPAGSAWSAVVHFREGRAEFTATEADARRFTETAAQLAPWAVHGWSKELAEEFTNRPVQFRNAVRKRRQEHATGVVQPERAPVPRRRPGR